MQLSVTITSTGGSLSIQDPHPTHGIFSKSIPAGGSLTFTCPWDIWHRISTQVEAHRAAGRCTVALAEVTPTGVDAAAGTNTTYNQSDWALLNSFRADITGLQSIVGSITSPFLLKGDIAVDTDFPLIADVQDGWTYVVTADVTDGAGATYTNTGQVFLAGQEIAWFGAAWIVVGDAVTNPFQFKGNVALNSDFPEPAATPSTGVRDGWVYRCTGPVTDDDPTKTNTGQAFLLGDVIVWRTAAWYLIHKAPSVAIPAALGVAAAGTGPRSSNEDHAHPHGDQLGGTLHAIAVDGGDAGFISGGQATVLNQQVIARLSGLDVKNAAAEVTGALSGDVTKIFVPTFVIMRVATVSGALINGDCTVNIGSTTPGGADIAAALPTGLALIDTATIHYLTIPMTPYTSALPGNTPLYANIAGVDTGADDMTIDITVLGYQV